MDDSKGFRRLLGNPLVHAGLVYISGAWIILEMVDYFITHYSLAEGVRSILLIILIAGLPVAIFLTWLLKGDKQEEEERTRNLVKLLRTRLWFSIPGAVILLLLLFTASRAIIRNSGAGELVSAQYSSLDLLMRDLDTEVSLAVLPFTDYTGRDGMEWLVAGQQETLITELSRISRIKPLRIISRYTVDTFKNSGKSIPELARELDVDYLVEASVMADEDTVNMQLRLVEVSPQENVIWSESCSSEYSQLLKLHGGIALQIAEEMELEMSQAEVDFLREDREVDPEAYKAYMQGLYHLNQMTPEEMDKGIELLIDAVSADPTEAFTHAALATGYIEIGHSPMDRGRALPKALEAANRAFELDSTLPELLYNMAAVKLYWTWEWEGSENYFLRALELNPNNAMAHYHYSWGLYLWGRMEEAIREHKLAQKYDPLNPLHTAWLAALYNFDGQYELAIETANEAMDIQEDYVVSHFVLGLTYLEMGEYEKAIEANRRVREIMPAWSYPLARSLVISGREEEARKLMKEYMKLTDNPFTALQKANFHATLGDPGEALRYLEFEPHHAWLAWAPILPWWSDLWEIPGFEEFRERVNLPDPRSSEQSAPGTVAGS